MAIVHAGPTPEQINETKGDINSFPDITWRQLRDVINKMSDEQIDASVNFEVNDEIFGFTQVLETTEDEEDEQMADIIGINQFWLV